MSDIREVDLSDKGGAAFLVTFPSQQAFTRILVSGWFNDKIYYDRTFKKGQSQAVIKLPRHPNRIALVADGNKFTSIKQIPLYKPEIPMRETSIRNYDIPDIQVRLNDTMFTPARIYGDKPIMEINPEKWKRYTEPTKLFIKRHELGHVFYDKETDADDFAIRSHLNDGWPLSQASYSLRHVLHPHLPNQLRQFYAMEKLKEYQKYCDG